MDTWIKKKPKNEVESTRMFCFNQTHFLKNVEQGMRKHDHRFTLPCVELQRVPWPWSFLSV